MLGHAYFTLLFHIYIYEWNRKNIKINGIFVVFLGRMFEGNAATMLKSLEHIQEYLPDDGYIWPGVSSL